MLHRPGSGMEVICSDLDSTLADTRPRRHLCPTVDKGRTWEEYAMACSNDKPIAGPIRLLRMLSAAGYGIHIVTNRPECARKLTLAWFDKYEVPCDQLVMPAYDGPVIETHKLAHIARIRRAGYEPLLFIEDWAETAKAIEAVGVPTLCLNSFRDEAEPQPTVAPVGTVVGREAGTQRLAIRTSEGTIWLGGN